MMISMSQMVYCLVIAGAYLLLMSLILEFLSRRLKLLGNFPPQLVEVTGVGWFVTFFIMEVLFFVVIPTVSYSFFYLIVPFSGVKAGLAATLFAFTLGAVPIVMGLSVRLRLPMQYLLFSLLGYLFKLGGAMVIIGYSYTL
ncbi:MAG: hypothetical protein JSV52_04015 [Candidatus Zixiibacteriota bacterium]|nr:MAG: hypothetical protein JSV52_04015 [candidate division Zixibacteria bacterium]